jgi:putative tricarboxylic transport membrane protein
LKAGTTAAGAALFAALLLTSCASEQTGSPRREGDADSRLHFLIPGAPGGGWDGTARGVGEALRRSGLVQTVSYENMSGGGGGRALAHMAATPGRQKQTLMVSSTPIVLRSLRGRLPQSYRDLVPVAALIGDYMTIAVRSDSPIESWPQVLAAFDDDPRAVPFAGGSVLGGMDHLVTAMALEASGREPRRLLYVPYDTGGKAMAALLSGETPVLTTGLGEAIPALEAGLVRVLAIAAAERVATVAEVPTLRELGTDLVFVNWRGFFGPPGLTEQEVNRHTQRLADLLRTAEWSETLERHGWVEMFHPADDFVAFLDEQEQRLAQLLSAFEEPAP